MESITGLQPMEDRQTGRVLQQAEKFKWLTGHPMHKRIKGDGKSRLKRTNFVALAKGEIGKHGIVDKQLQTSAERKSIGIKYITDIFP
jgi:hypothetical protein